MYDMEKVLRERKIKRQGINFRPSVWQMLHELSIKKHISMAELLEIFIIDEYKKECVNK